MAQYIQEFLPQIVEEKKKYDEYCASQARSEITHIDSYISSYCKKNKDSLIISLSRGSVIFSVPKSTDLEKKSINLVKELTQDKFKELHMKNGQWRFIIDLFPILNNKTVVTSITEERDTHDFEAKSNSSIREAAKELYQKKKKIEERKKQLVDSHQASREDIISILSSVPNQSESTSSLQKSSTVDVV